MYMERTNYAIKRKKPKKSTKPKPVTQKQSQKQSVIINLNQSKQERRKRAKKKSKATPMPSAPQRTLVSAEQQQPQFVYVPPRFPSDTAPPVIQKQNVLNPNAGVAPQWSAPPVLNATNLPQVGSPAPIPTLAEQAKFMDRMRREAVLQTEQMRRDAETEAIADQMRKGLKTTPSPLAPEKPKPSPLAVPPPMSLAERLAVGQSEGGRRKKTEFMEAKMMGTEDRQIKPKSGRKAKAPAMAQLQENVPMSAPLSDTYGPAQMLFSAPSVMTATTDAELPTPLDEDEETSFFGFSSGAPSKKAFEFI